MALTLEMLEEQYLLADLTHIYTDSSAEDAIKNRDNDIFVRTPTGQTVSYKNATGSKCSDFKAETSVLQTVVTYIAKIKSPEDSHTHRL